MKRRLFLKVLSFVLSFVLVFLVLQNILLPKHMKSSTLSVEGFNKLEQNSLDVLFLGASQMFCTIDSQLLTEKYRIKSYDLGASSQPLLASKYYLEYALKTQKPKLVILEVSSAFFDESCFTDEAISWSYAPMPLERIKWDSLMEVFNGDTKRVIENTFLTFFQYHNRWNSLGPQDFMYYFGKRDYSHRGFLALDGCQKVKFDKSENLYGVQLPEISTKALDSISEICEQSDIQLILLKVPVPGWGEESSMAITEYADKNGLMFIDLNKSIDEIGINEEKDYANNSHLNGCGAEKVTEYMGGYLTQFFDAYYLLK